MKKFFRKLKKSNRVLRYIYYIVSIVYIVTLFFFIKSLLSLSGIETVLRIVFIVFFILYIVLYCFWNLLNLLRRKYKALIITSIVSVIFIIIFCVGSYYINMVYSNIDNITEDDRLMYTSYLIALKDTEFDNDSSVGMLDSENEIEWNVLARKLYSEEKLANSITDYTDYNEMIRDLYNGDIDAIFVPGNYVTLFSNEEQYQNISSETKVLYEYSEEMANQDLVLSSDKTFDEPLTFLLMGVDSEKAGLNANAAFNGDTLMLITFNPTTLTATMVSIPRDTYVPIACNNNRYAKINSSAAYGTSCVIDTVSNFLDVEIDYYVKINFKGVVELVDAIGGVEVDVEAPTYNSDKYDGMMCEQNSDRHFGSSLVCIEPGLQTLNGEQALAYARNRHMYIGGDLDRIRHQQQVVEAIASKALQFSSITDLQNILNAISSNIATNMDTNTILSGYNVVKNMVSNVIGGEDLLNINKAYLETYSLPVYVPSMGYTTSAQGYYVDSLEDIRHALKVSLELEEDEAIKTFSFSVNEPYEITSPGSGLRQEKSSSTLPNFIGSTVSVAEKFCNEHGIDFHIEYVDPDSEHYNPNVAVGLIGDQSEFIGVLLSTVDELTVYVVNSRESISEEPDNGDETNSGTDSEDENNSSDNNENSEDNPDDGNEDDTTGDDITDIILGN
ncbi:MAG TPA: LCP family protein [Candidatus Onthocola stercoravium]|nr:LCP family protein [Candidatus Onthocola stercoravium]